jgi:hypothetical protein
VLSACSCGFPSLIRWFANIHTQPHGNSRND